MLFLIGEGFTSDVFKHILEDRNVPHIETGFPQANGRVGESKLRLETDDFKTDRCRKRSPFRDK